MKSDNVSLIQNSVNQIKDIISKPVMVEKNFDELISIHQSINNMVNEYYSSSISKIKQECRDVLLDYCSKFKTEYAEDLKRLDELNKTIHNSSGNVKCESWNNIVFNECNMFKPELYDEDIYYSLNENVDINIKQADLRNPKIKKMIKEYNEIKNEIITELEEFMNDVESFEKNVLKAKNEILRKSMKSLNVMYICHLNFLDSVIKKKKCSLKVNGVEVKGKQSEWLKGWMNDE
jgi:hypothetical protein